METIKQFLESDLIKILIGGSGLGLLLLLNIFFDFWKNIKILFKNINFTSKYNWDDHKIFDEIDSALLEDSITMSSTVRNEIAKELKDSKLKTYRNLIESFLENDFKKIKKEDIIYLSKELLNKYIKTSNLEFMKKALDQKERDVADLIIKKYNYYESKQINNIIEGINEERYTKCKNHELINIILSLYSFLLRDLIRNTKDTIEIINGELTDKYFMGKKIGPHNEKI